MKNRFSLMGKIAISLFITSLIIMLLGTAVLYAAFRKEAVQMNSRLQESNLAIAGKNIAEKTDAAEYGAISLFFDREIREKLLNRRVIDSQVELHNQVYGQFLSILNTTSISYIALYRKDGFGVSAGMEIPHSFFDYDSCMDKIQENHPAFSEESSYAVWIPVSVKMNNGVKEAFFMNARILRDVSSNEAVGLMVFYISEKVISEMYSFFGEGSCLTDAQGSVISAQNPERIGTMLGEDGLSQGYIYVQVKNKDWFLAAVPERSTLREMQSAVFFNGITAITLCTLLSIAAALFISRGLTRNIRHLKEVMERTDAGRLDLRYYGKSCDEVDYLGKTYNKVLDDIQKYIAEDKKKQKQIQEGEIRFLQAQINPHLLYNTLDVVIFHIEKSNMEMALCILQSMSGFFKLSLGKGENFHTVRTEITHIRYYMDLQRLCRGKEIALITEIPEELAELKVPCITFQPIVENAYLHGFAGNVNDGWIKISVARIEKEKRGRFSICIMDNGMGMEQEKVRQIEEALHAEKCRGDGYGLWNVYRRMKLYYGEESSIEVESEFGEYTKVTLTIVGECSLERSI